MSGAVRRCYSGSRLETAELLLLYMELGAGTGFAIYGYTLNFIQLKKGLLSLSKAMVELYQYLQYDMEETVIHCNAKYPWEDPPISSTYLNL